MFCSLDLLFLYVYFTVVVKVFLKSLINKRYADPNSELEVCGLEISVIEFIHDSFFKTLMSVIWENTNVIQMLNVLIPVDPTTANVKKDLQEMA